MKINNKHLKQSLDSFFHSKYRNIIMVRHAQSQANHLNIICGWTETPLTQKGKQQAQSLNPLLINYKNKFNKIFCSDLSRSIDTMNYALGNPQHIKDQRLREMNFGRMEKKIISQLTSKQLQDFNSIHYQAPQGQTWKNVHKRVNELISNLNDGTYMFFTHGGLMCSYTWKFGVRHCLNNCSMVGLSFQKDECKQMKFLWQYQK